MVSKAHGGGNLTYKDSLIEVPAIHFRTQQPILERILKKGGKHATIPESMMDSGEHIPDNLKSSNSPSISLETLVPRHDESSHNSFPHYRCCHQAGMIFLKQIFSIVKTQSLPRFLKSRMKDCCTPVFLLLVYRDLLVKFHNIVLMSCSPQNAFQEVQREFGI
ncbi:hypothetical protein BDY19DRAFT_200901 [Irpex rosettiformis]|uniref:Uncharacterized protein n=1 Tax=Irpex rosettiformis TaxID=378272 RepID=A0ACB8U103_9APHY|nr:hypothetical protein BDY19DRAFT_200901 [Irpex rosettiformis]